MSVDVGTGWVQLLGRSGQRRKKIHFKLCFFDSCPTGAILLVLRSWPSTQPPLAACTEGSGVQFAQQSDYEKLE